MFRAFFRLLVFCLPLTFVGCGDSGNKVIDVTEIPPEWQEDPTTDQLDIEP
jgi:hypothetical protein